MPTVIMRANYRRGEDLIPPGVPVKITQAEADRLHPGIIVREASTAEARHAGASSEVRVPITAPESQPEGSLADLVGESTAEALEDIGLDTVEKVRAATLEELQEAENVGQKTAEKIAKKVAETETPES